MLSKVIASSSAILFRSSKLPTTPSMIGVSFSLPNLMSTGRFTPAPPVGAVPKIPKAFS